MNYLQKVGSNKGNSRIWIEGKKLTQAGFDRHSRYDIEYDEGVIVLVLNDNGSKKVSGKTMKGLDHPVIDLTNKRVTSLFDSGSYVQVDICSYGTIVITQGE